MTLRVGMVLFPGLTQLDMTAPYEVFCRMPDTSVAIIAATLAPVRTEWGLVITPDASFGDAPELDILCVPGGWGVNAMLENQALMDFIRSRAPRARYVTSVCSGALLLGAAGLLRGYRATTHWMSLPLLGSFGAIPVEERVVMDRTRITAAGVTAGLDLAFMIAQQILGERASREIQLAIEYDPDRRFTNGSPRSADPDLKAAVMQRASKILAERAAIVARVSALKPDR